MIAQIGVLLCLLAGLATAHRSPLARSEIGHSSSLAADYLLPNNLTVDLYTLELEPNFVTDTFNGSVTIRFTTRVTTNHITVHIYQISINWETINLLDANGAPTSNPVVGIGATNDDRQFFTAVFANNLLANGTYSLVIGSFSGILNLDNDGLYLGRYVNEAGEVVKLAATQFQPTSARRAFPCFDEPALKAQFDVSVIRTSFYNALTNGPLINTTQIAPGIFRDVFARTSRMSTYLVAFVISDFTYVAEDIHKIFGRPAAIADGRGEYALGISPVIVETISEFLQKDYNWPKLDQVGIPDDYFSAGAMENWGLFLYRETFLLYINNVTASNIHEFINIIVSHEIGHTWNGNLVSPAWWTYLWLNEGFATYFEYYGPHIVEPDMEFLEQVVIKSVQFALDRDDTATTRPMNLEAGSPADVLSLFDVVAYDKAGSVIRMMEGVLTTPVFRRGLTIFLTKLEYDVARPSDLYDAWQEALAETNLTVFPVNETVESVMTTWDSTPGFPLVTITRNYEAGTATFSQRRFISLYPNNTLEDLWYIPITYATYSYNANFTDTSIDVWLTTRNSTLSLAGLGANDWLVANIGQKGYYRVNYDTTNWYRIISLLSSDSYSIVPKTSRANLVHDAFHLARFGVINYQVALDLSEYLVREIDYVPLFPFINNLVFLEPYLSNTNVFSAFQSYTLRLLNASYNDVGIEQYASDRHVTKLNRISVLTWVCRFNGGNCRNLALDRLRQWQNNSEAFIAPNLQTVVPCSALRVGNQNDWNFVYQQYLTAPEAVISTRLLNSLGCSESDQILAGYLNLVVNATSNFPFADRLAAWASVYNSGNYGRNFAFNYIRLFYNTVSASFTPAQVSSILTGIASRFSSETQVAELQWFANSVGGGTVFANAINTAQNNVNWANENLNSALIWFWLSESRQK